MLGGDHSITYPSAAAVARHVWPRKVGVVHFDAHADTGADQWGNLYGHGEPMRRLIEEGWVDGPNFVQIGLRGYWPDREDFGWMREHGLRWHTMVEIEERGSEAVVDDAIAEALDGPDCIYLSVDIDVVDPGWLPAPARPNPEACSRASFCAPCARSWAASNSSAWTSSRCRRPTTTPGSPRCSLIEP